MPNMTYKCTQYYPSVYLTWPQCVAHYVICTYLTRSHYTYVHNNCYPFTEIGVVWAILCDGKLGEFRLFRLSPHESKCPSTLARNVALKNKKAVAANSRGPACLLCLLQSHTTSARRLSLAIFRKVTPKTERQVLPISAIESCCHFAKTSRTSSPWSGSRSKTARNRWVSAFSRNSRLQTWPRTQNLNGLSVLQITFKMNGNLYQRIFRLLKLIQGDVKLVIFNASFTPTLTNIK